MKNIFLIIIIILVFSCSEKKVTPEKTFLNKALTSSDTNFLRASAPRNFIFPDDYYSHNRYKVEWWYFTGNLATADGHRFGYQFTIFRNAMSSDSIKSGTDFASNQMYFAHFAISDISGDKFYFDERTSRAGAALAGCDYGNKKIFIGNWQISMEFVNGDTVNPEFNLKAVSNDKSIDFKLIPFKKMVLHGDRGLSQKSGDSGNASYYYSFTRLKTAGELTLNGKKYSVTGLSWQDREWSTSALKPNQIGWDWFSLQFAGGEELMLYKIRDTSGKTDYALGTFVDKNGEKTNLTSKDFEIRNMSYFKSDKGVVYPASWEIKLLRNGMVIEARSLIQDQVVSSYLMYYEGALEFSSNGTAAGKGYVELTGY